MNDTPYTYLFIRKDMPKPTQLVQLAHAAAHAGHEFGDHSHMVLFGCSDEQQILEAAEHLRENNIKFHLFFEPDNNLGYTAIATESLRGDARKPLKRFKMLRD